MSIPLFLHNEEAYRKAASMLESCGKAAVIHPTGTGKSFIGFKLAEDHPESSIVWLSPSEYIFRTQKENLQAVSPDTKFDNIRFITYTKLTMLDQKSMKGYEPDFVVLDEFHRCGAKEWGNSLEIFLRLFPKAKILGLSATHVRYLDNQRDMAEELFDGHIASYMTLGEAIALGILESPQYVISVYSYQQELEKYQKRIENLKSDGYKSENLKMLDLLRRSLEHADGLREIFRKYIREKNSKYILFCANREHMEEMAEHTRAWFGDIDSEPHTYQVYSEDSAAEKIFAEFKTDTSEHLKLLYCIDMLNEGIHVDQVDGVVLFRPTTSPTIYKQQIGRALSASRGERPIIFDIVNNFDSLYSISSIQEEISLAVIYYRERGEGARIVNDRFEIYDEVRESRKLFDELERSLSAPWEICFQAAKKYYEEHGDLNVPKRYQTPEGISLGLWIITQKRVRNGQISGNLSEAQIERLDAIGMVWENRLEANWEKYFEAAEVYFQEHGNLDVAAGYVTEAGLNLGRWIVQNRQHRAGNIRAGLMSDDRIRRLDSIGMIWDKNSYLWEQNFCEAEKYYKRYGNLDVPFSYKTEDGLGLGHWIYQLRRKKAQAEHLADPESSDVNNPASLTEDQIVRLDAIGMVWEKGHEGVWEKNFAYAVDYAKKNGNLEMPATFVTKDGFALGKWIYNQRLRYAENRMSESQIQKLESLRMTWNIKQSWDERYELAKEYFEKHGNLRLTQDYVTDSGIWLGKWIYEQRRKRKQLTQDQIRKLDAIGMDWLSRQERARENQYEAVEQYFVKHGNLRVPDDYRTADGKSVKGWLNTQRRKQKNGQLSAAEYKRLSGLGMQWSKSDYKETSV